MRTDEPDIEYQVVSHISESGLQAWVSREIRAGWEPIGGVTCAAPTVSKTTFYQAMVRRKQLV